MKAELDGLERKVAQVVDLCTALRAENHRLRDRLAALEEEKAALAARMTEARLRLEGLLDKLPAE